MVDNDDDDGDWEEEAPSEPARVEYIRQTLIHCERELQKLRRDPHAWKLLRVTDNSPRPGRSRSVDEARVALGPDFRTVKPATKRSDQLPAYRELVRIAERLITGDGSLSRAQAMDRAINDNPEIYKRYLRHARRTRGAVRQLPAWRYAEMAALMAHALERIDNPATMFAAGLAYGEFHQYDYQRAPRRNVRKLSADLPRKCSLTSMLSANCGMAARKVASGERKHRSRLTNAGNFASKTSAQRSRR